MRYQVVVLDTEIGDAIEISSISWKRFPSPDDQGSFNDLKVYLGLCASDDLVAAFDDNYISGTKTLVLSESSYTTSVVGINEWFEIPFTTPFWYNGQDNLIIEIEWSSGSGSLYSWSALPGGIRRIYGPYGTTSALVLDDNFPTIQLNGTLSLENTTFAQIKAAF
jgi:hypothetical protein